MQDFIANGTGDSRFLKSALAEDTTWETALSQLRSGTFPIDLNGINSEGVYQTGTPLNKNTLLSDSTATGLGLPNTATVNDAFVAVAQKSASLVFSDAWTGDDPYTQTVTVTGATSNSKIDLQPTAAQLTQLLDDGVNALWVENNDGTLTAYALGGAPTAAMTVQCTVTEVLT